MHPVKIRFIAKEALRLRREEKRILQKEMASLIRLQTGRKGLNRPSYSWMESGDKEVSLEVAVVICRILGSEVDDLFEPAKTTPIIAESEDTPDSTQARPIAPLPSEPTLANPTITRIFSPKEKEDDELA